MNHPVHEHAIAFETVVSELFDENAYIVYLPGRTDCVVVDPGLDAEQITLRLTQLGKQPVAILNTHGHADHIAGNGAVKAQWPGIPLIIGHGDAPKLGDPVANLSAGYGFPITSPPADRTVREGDVLQLAGITWRVRETPGHSAGHVAFVATAETPGGSARGPRTLNQGGALAFGGDVLFAGSVGRTDFFDGDFEQLAESIRSQLYSLPDETLVLPGHGPTTTIGREKRTNPFVRG